MKKVYNYHTGKLNESIELNRNIKDVRMNESAFDDILESRELHNEDEIANIISVNNGEPIVFWAYPGNDLLNTVQDACDAQNLACAVLSSRELMSTSVADISDVDVIIINELTRAQKPVFNEAVEDIRTKAEEGILVICLCRIDAAYNEVYAPELLNFDNYTYSPQYNRQSKFIDPEFDDAEDEAFESVTEKFSKYRKLYEEEEEKSADDDPFAGLDMEPAGDEGGENSGEDKGEEGSEDSEDKGEDKEGGEDDEYVPMTAIIITVAKDDADKCKDEMVEAGISEDGIEILDGEEDDENAKIRVDADYAKELKDYLSGKGIDLEEKIGGEIVDDTEEDEDKEKEDEEGKDEDKDKEEGDGEDLSFDDEFGDLFADDEESSDES